jgi:hypothetical protein
LTLQPFPRGRLAKVANARKEPDNLTHTKRSRRRGSGLIIHKSSEFPSGSPAKSLVMPMRSNPAARSVNVRTADQFTAPRLPTRMSSLLGFREM